jgi:hypothetical protein
MSSSEGDERTTYSLVDGRTWVRPNDQFRILYELQSGATLFVAGSDNDGEYVLLIGGQDGLPAACRYALRYGGRDWGDSIESQNLLWEKAPAFVGLNGPDLQSGSAYPDNAGFCLNDKAQVTSVYLAEPSAIQSQSP